MIEDDTGSDWTLAEGATGSTSSDYGDVLPEKQHSASSLVSEEKAVTEQPPSRDALIAKASKPLEVYRKVPETVYHAVVVGGFRVGKTTFLRMLDRVFARRPGCATSIAQGGEVVTISFMDSLASGRHIFEFREKHVSDQTGGMDVTDVLAYISDRQKEYQNLEQDAARLMPMSELADARVDLCLWLLPPQELTSVEVDIISAVWERLPVIPIISKADSLDAGELEEIRANVAARLEHFYGRFSKDGIVNLQDLLKRAGAHVSGVFSTINSVSVDSSITSCGWPVKAYPWGSVEPFLHSDLQSLLSFIMEKLPQTLKLETEIRYRASLKVPQDDSDSSEVASVIAAQWSSNMLAVPPEAADVAAKMIAQADVPDSGPLRTPKPLSGQGSHTVKILPAAKGNFASMPLRTKFVAGGRTWHLKAEVQPKANALTVELLRMPLHELTESCSSDYIMSVTAMCRLCSNDKTLRHEQEQEYQLDGSQWQLLRGTKRMPANTSEAMHLNVEIKYVWRRRMK